ncbi:Sigma-54-dependent Fis family transcriptional regulator [Sulfidibacter corallicola]|uniref:Sigma-54-dependent Fis family transcriptional regulator n=1 Tax=Sulfidibacter corallicola TaxID=2818388 RepID=A0A8A4TWK2_SULCO|nr:sigma-54 dependent transcriptional regulator [Sulfidibacter corallicola]QTD54319.1 sigma-54-dependent Fis family transcriptional regulator [Sulfidibacter corallicola]
MDSILLIEDRPGLRQVYAEFLRNLGYMVVEAGSVEDAHKAMAVREFSLVLTDYMLPGANGMDFLKQLKERDPDYLVILMTAFGEIKLAVEATRAGAFDFLEKPIDLDHLKIVIERALEHRRLRRKDTFHEAQSVTESEEIIGQAPALKAALAMAKKVAPSDANCLLLGESGVGKELFAKYIHGNSRRAVGALVSINCAAIPGELIESELFGHEKGAFTGAVGKKAGLIEMADGGTLFLDEIGEMPLSLQPKLLRVIQAKEFRRVGGSRTLKSDIRVVAATNRDLKTGTREGWFREDLYYRLAVFPIDIPPLRDRRGDLPLLISAILRQARFGHADISPKLLAQLQAYHWPGNVRELKNLLERAIILSQGQPLDVNHFPANLFDSAENVGLRFHLDLNRSFKDNLSRLEGQLERTMIELLLKEESGHRERVARRFGVSVKTLYNRIKALGIQC